VTLAKCSEWAISLGAACRQLNEVASRQGIDKGSKSEINRRKSWRERIEMSVRFNGTEAFLPDNREQALIEINSVHSNRA
jgi:hypothetical protein